MPIEGWDAAVAKAQKVLGDTAKIPQPKPVIEKSLQASNKIFDDFVKAREDLEAQLLALIDADTDYVNAVQQLRDVIDESDFGLDMKKKDDLKKIKDAQKTLTGCLDKEVAKSQENSRRERELNKHLANIKNYKPNK